MPLISLQSANWRVMVHFSPSLSSKGPAVHSRHTGQKAAADGLKQHLKYGRGNSLQPSHSCVAFSIKWLAPQFIVPLEGNILPPKQSNSTPPKMRLGLYNDGGSDPTVSLCLRLRACIYGFCYGETIYFLIILNVLIAAVCFFFVFCFFRRNCHADIFSLERHAFKTPCQKPSDRMSQTCHILSLKKNKTTKHQFIKNIYDGGRF